MIEECSYGEMLYAMGESLFAALWTASQFGVSIDHTTSTAIMLHQTTMISVISRVMRCPG
jgi:hypothetical protein